MPAGPRGAGGAGAGAVRQGCARSWNYTQTFKGPKHVRCCFGV